jgi:hypothetical protein
MLIPSHTVCNINLRQIRFDQTARCSSFKPHVSTDQLRSLLHLSFLSSLKLHSIANSWHGGLGDLDCRLEQLLMPVCSCDSCVGRATTACTCLRGSCQESAWWMRDMICMDGELDDVARLLVLLAGEVGRRLGLWEARRDGWACRSWYSSAD